MTTCKNSFFLVLKTSDNYKLHVLHVHHSSRASGTVDCLLTNLLFTRIMNETESFERIFMLFKISVVVTFH